MPRSLVTFWMTLLLLACTQSQSQKGHAVIEAYSAAYNAKNLTAMSALMHPDIEWLSVKGSVIEVEVQGKAALVDSMGSYFDDPAMATGSLRDWSINGDHVAVTEIATWNDAQGRPKAQSALTVYELNDGLIRRVYYYPEIKN